MQYRILNIDGSISRKLYKLIGQDRINAVKATLRSDGDPSDTVVHRNRLIPFEKSDHAICIISGGVDMVICPKCLNITKKEVSKGEFECSSGCGTYQYHDLSSGSSVLRSTKVNSLKTKNLFDIETVKAYPQMIVYSKTNKFNNPQIDSRSVVIIHNSDSPRKMQFNTYNGSLGKKSAALPLEAFNNNQMPAGKCPWVPIASLAAEEQRLIKGGYTKIL